MFPSYNASMYKQYFETERAYNSVLLNEVVKNIGRVRNELRRGQGNG
jgi:hypothetical protein